MCCVCCVCCVWCVCCVTVSMAQARTCAHLVIKWLGCVLLECFINHAQYSVNLVLPNSLPCNEKKRGGGRVEVKNTTETKTHEHTHIHTHTHTHTHTQQKRHTHTHTHTTSHLKLTCAPTANDVCGVCVPRPVSGLNSCTAAQQLPLHSVVENSEQ